MASSKEASSSSTFIKSSTFDGAKPGYVFKKGAQGLGYYVDTPPVVTFDISSLPPTMRPQDTLLARIFFFFLQCAFLGCFIFRANDAVLFRSAYYRFGISDDIAIGLLLATVAFLVYQAAAANTSMRIRSVQIGFMLALFVKFQADRTVVAPELTCSSPPCNVYVTGANSGIGFGISEIMYEQGHNVYMGCRSPKKCNAAATAISGKTLGRAIPSPRLDLSNLKAVQKNVNNLVSKDGLAVTKIDLLVLNAGLTPTGNKTTMSGLELGFGTMNVGHQALIQYLEKAGVISPSSTKIIVVSSDAMRFGSFHSSILQGNGEGDLRGEYTVGCKKSAPICSPVSVPGNQMLGVQLPFYGLFHRNFGSYGRSKLGNVYMAQELSRRFGYSAMSVHPGMVHTPMAENMGVPGFERVSLVVMKAILRSPREAAAIVLQGAANKKFTGQFFNGMGEPLQLKDLPWQAQDAVAARAVWDVSARLISSQK